MDLSITKDFNILEEALQQAAALAPRILMGFLVFCAFWIASIVFRKIILRVRWPIPGDILGLAERAGEIALIVMGILTGLGTMGINISALVAGLENGMLRPIIGKELPLAEAAQAHRAVMEPGAFGKVVLVP